MNPALLLALAAAFLSMATVFVSKTFADAVFLAEFGVAYVPHFFVAQAIGLIATSAGYGALIRRRAAAPIDATILLAFAGTAVLGPLAVGLGGPALFAVSLGLIVLSTLTNLAVWNAATAVVSGRRSRWFLPRAGAASTAGAVVGSFGSSAVVGVLGVEALAPLIALMALGALGFRMMLVRRSSEWRLARADALVRARRAAEADRAAGAPKVRREASPRLRLVRILAIATIEEACLTAFIEYGFKREVVESFTDHDEIGVFLALFYGISNAGLLLLQLFASSRLLTTRSLRFSLSLQPAALLVAVLAWTVFPVLAIAALARGLEGVLKFGVARPAQEVALTPLTELDRKRWKVLLRGAYNQGGGAVAGLLLIAAAPLVTAQPMLIPIASAVTALVWLVLQRFGSDRYLDALGSALGLRRLSLRDHRDEVVIDRDGMGRIVRLTGVEDPHVARFGRELLSSVSHDGRALVPYLGAGPPSQREALYRLLAGRPHRSCAAALRDAMQREDQRDAAAAACLDALAALGDSAHVERARALAGEELPGPATDPVGASAWYYLAQVGALDDEPDRLDQVLELALERDGARAADILRALTGRGALGAPAAERMAAAAARHDEPPRRLQGLLCCAALGWPAPLERVVEALSGREPWLDQVIACLDGRALGAMLAMEGYRHAPPRVRARVLRVLRSSDLPDVAYLAGRELLDPDPMVRELAARTLLRRARDHGEALPRDLAERALSLQLDRFALYVRARPGYASTARESQMEVKYRSSSLAELTSEAFFIDELERRTERSLSRLCAVLALFGNPSSVYAAERALRAPTFKRRRQALDILQEVAKGRERGRLLELLESYLLPPRQVPDGAREAVCEADPWLARCARSGSDPAMARLWALRATLLFDDVDGELLDALAVRANEVEAAPGQVVVEEGAPGDALYVVMDGVVTVERGGKVVAQLAVGQAFGELALLDDQPRQATVRCERPSRLLRLPQATFDAALAENPEIGLGLVRALVRWLRQGDEMRRPPAYRR